MKRFIATIALAAAGLLVTQTGALAGNVSKLFYTRTGIAAADPATQVNGDYVIICCPDAQGVKHTLFVPKALLQNYLRRGATLGRCS